MDLRHTTTFAATSTCNATPTVDVGIGANARIIAPGAANHSVLVKRMNERDQDAATQVHTAGVELNAEWINSLTACP